jgi:PAS domain-containing protein
MQSKLEKVEKIQVTIMHEKPTYEELEQRIRELAHAETEHKRAKEELLESENNYRTLAESANSVILRWDTKGNIIYLNPYGPALSR